MLSQMFWTLTIIIAICLLFSLTRGELIRSFIGCFCGIFLGTFNSKLITKTKKFQIDEFGPYENFIYLSGLFGFVLMFLTGIFINMVEN